MFRESGYQILRRGDETIGDFGLHFFVVLSVGAEPTISVFVRCGGVYEFNNVMPWGARVLSFNVGILKPSQAISPFVPISFPSRSAGGMRFQRIHRTGCR